MLLQAVNNSALSWGSAASMHSATDSKSLGDQRRVSTADMNRNLGSFAVRYYDIDEGLTFTMRHQFVSGGRVGARHGYETLKAAMQDLAKVTEGPVPAAAVIERDGRFYGHVLKSRDMEQGFRASLQAAHLETDERAAVRELRSYDRFSRLHALVDGAWSRRFRVSA